MTPNPQSTAIFGADPESPLDIEHVSFISEQELRKATEDTLNIIRFLDKIHAEAVLGQ